MGGKKVVSLPRFGGAFFILFPLNTSRLLALRKLDLTALGLPVLSAYDDDFYG
jgi:hypothetical protein